jgi:RimJ/RimL family protein N-acetyltransferase
VPALVLPDPLLSNGDVLLRPWAASDVPALSAACSDPEIPRWTAVPHDYTEHHAREFVAGSEAELVAGRELDLAIVDRAGSLAGAIGLTSFAWPHLRAEVGYWVAREARGRGVGTTAVRLLSRWALRDLGLARIELLANPENEASVRLALRAGFRREGTLRAYRRRHGEAEDLEMFSLLSAELEA